MSEPRPKALMMRTPVADSSMTVVTSPCWSWTRRAMLRYSRWKRWPSQTTGTAAMPVTNASRGSRRTSIASTTRKVQTITIMKTRPKPM